MCGVTFIIVTRALQGLHIRLFQRILLGTVEIIIKLSTEPVDWKKNWALKYWLRTRQWNFVKDGLNSYMIAMAIKVEIAGMLQKKYLISSRIKRTRPTCLRVEAIVCLSWKMKPFPSCFPSCKLFFWQWANIEFGLRFPFWITSAMNTRNVISFQKI